ncbi:MAG TPA: hypothetical protein VHV30_01885 [Polyangiaceae bacterium]|jgi:hypothetical protein|nr:hypothetical protein [Polyangiaceae bacterium]
MPVAPDLEADPAIVGPLGGLLLSYVRAGSPMLALRAVRWWRDLARLGVHLPLFAVHDLGLLYAAPRERVEIGARPGSDAAAQRLPGLAPLLASYRGLVSEVAESHAAATARGMRLGDDLVVVVLARLLSTIARDAGMRPPWPTTLPLDVELVRDLDPQLPALFTGAPRAYEQRFLGAFARSHLRVLTLADATDLDTLRLLGMVGGDSVTAGALAHVDLLAALSSPAANDIVGFSLELLPSVLETRHARAAVTNATHAVHGYGGVAHQGSVDSMVLTELAWHDEELARRMLDGELLFYSREQAPPESRRLHHIVVDASASMRGEREIFARGLAIALGKKLQLGGEDVWLRFFDSRLYDVQRPRGRASLPAAWLLAFKGERGRNPARVFAQLATEMALLRERDARDPVIHLITHAALHVPRHLVQEVRRQAHLFAVFILPSGGKLDLEWLDLLEGHAVVDHAALQQKSTRAAAATKIVDDAAVEGP